MNDLEGIDFVDDFKRIGVASIKIEGRLKPITYVRHAVQAYRMVLDAGEDNKHAALVEAHDLLDASLGRRRSSGYFLSPTPKDAIISSHSGNIGTHLGTFSRFTHENGNVWGIMVAKAACREGDRLRLHFDKSGDRTAFTVKQVERRDSGQTAILLPDNCDRRQLQGKIDLYRVDTVKTTGQATGAESKPLTIKPFSERRIKAVKEHSTQVQNSYARHDYQAKSQSRAGKGQLKPAELWIRFDTAGPIYHTLPFKADRFVIPINKKTLSETGHLSRYFGKNRNSVIWALPAVVHHHRNASLRRDVNVLIRSGFRSFQISTIGQLNLFSEKNISLFGDFSLNILNSRTMNMLTELGLKGFQFSIETDRAALKQALSAYRRSIPQHDSGQPGTKHRRGLVGLTVYGSPPLFISRIHAQNVSFNQKITSPKSEHFVIQKTEGTSITRPKKPFSLLPFKKELETMGIDYMVIDLSGMPSGKKELQDLAKRIEGKERMKKLPAFNFSGKLE